MTPNQIKDHFRVPEMEDCYLLLCDGPPVNVRSQQIRALNLLHALSAGSQEPDGIRGKRIAVIGGGAAGITFAAGASSLGGQVTLFEKSAHLLHMQLGCWHRPLHPEIFTWPEDTAYRPVSHLPQLGWATGRAHDVADTLLAQFEGIRVKLQAEGQKLQVRQGTAVQVTPDRRIIPSDTNEPFDLVILAVGFGVERLPYRLPWNSYWRIDPLDQTLLNEDTTPPVIVVVGTGDGALIEILRSCIQSFEQGALLDGILNATLDDQVLREKVADIESSHVPAERFERYCELRSDAVAEILLANLRDAQVHWLVREATPFRKFSLPINRFIVGQIFGLQNRGEIWARLGKPQGKQLNLITKVQLLDVLPRGKGCQVNYTQQGAHNSIDCDNAIIRFGAQRDEARKEREATEASSEPLLSSIGRVLAVSSKRDTILDAVRQHRDQLNSATEGLSNPDKNIHICCRMPHWKSNSLFTQRLERFDPRRSVVGGDGMPKEEKPILRARFVTGFPPDATREYTVYRIKAELDGLPELKVEHRSLTEPQSALRIIYDLHPQDGRPVTRAAFGPRHELWLNTNSNYRIRARVNDGREWDLGTVYDALLSGGSRVEVELGDNLKEPFDVALSNVQTTRQEKDQEKKKKEADFVTRLTAET